MKKMELRSFLLAISITLCITGVMLYYLQMKGLESELQTKVVVAVTNIPANTLINSSQVKEVMIPSKLTVPGHTTGQNNVIGNFAKENIYPGEQILTSRLRTGTIDEGLAAMIPPNYRAITIGVDKASGVSGLIKNGDYVDVIALVKSSLGQDVVRTILQYVKVLDADIKGDAEKKFITLCLTPEQSQELLFASELGKIKLVLRNAGDKNVSNVTYCTIESLE